jgi:hypothetical protein
MKFMIVETKRKVRALQKLFIVAVCIFAVVVAIGGYYIVGVVTDVHNLSKQNKATSDARFKDRKANDARLAAEQAATDAKVRQLACILVSTTNENAPGFPASRRATVIKFRKVYACPPYSKATARDPFGKLPPRPSATSTTTVPGKPTVGPTTQPGVTSTPRKRTTAPPRSTARPSSSPSRPRSSTPTPSPSRDGIPVPKITLCAPLIGCIIQG